MKLLRKVGVTSQIFQIFIQDSSSTTGAGLTGLTNASGSLTAYYHRDTDTTATAISLVTMTVGTFTSSGFKEIDATNMPGWYQLCPPNAALASGAASCAIHLKGATNMAPLPIEVDLDGQVDVTFWNGTVVATPATAGIPDVNAKNINNVATSSVTTINANVGQTQPVNFTGTAGSALVKSDMVDVAGSAVSTGSAQIGVNLVQILGTALTETSGQIAAAFKKFFNIATPASTMDALTLVATATNLTNAPTSGDFTATMKTSLNAATPAVTVSDKTGFSLTSAYDPAKSASQAGDAMALTSGERTTLAAAIWAALTSGLTTTGSIGKWILDKLDAVLSTRLAASSYTAPDNSSITAIKAKTDNLPASPAAVSDIPTATQNADALLKRDMSVVSGEADRSPLNALRAIRNKTSISGSTMTVTKEDDSTAAWTASVTADPSAAPITGIDPA